MRWRVWQEPGEGAAVLLLTLLGTRAITRPPSKSAQLLSGPRDLWANAPIMLSPSYEACPLLENGGPGPPSGEEGGCRGRSPAGAARPAGASPVSPGVGGVDLGTAGTWAVGMDLGH